MDSRSFTALSICSGGGGLDLGLGLAVPDARTVCYVESEAYACEVLARRMEEELLDEAPVWTDLRTFDGKPWRGVVDCIVGGYPCQCFSLSGRKKGEKDPRYLWPHVARLVREIRPPFVFFENVSNHIRIGYEVVRGELQELGYVVEQGIFSAEEMGASHLRKRLFILGYSKGNDERRARTTEEQDVKAGGPSTVQDVADADHLAEGAKRPGKAKATKTLGKTGGLGSQLADLHSSERGPGDEGVKEEEVVRRRKPGDGGPSVADTKGMQRKEGVVGNPDGEGSQVDTCERENLSKKIEAPERASWEMGIESLCLFPPGPSDAKWGQALEAFPAIEPAVCVVADELAAGVEQRVVENRIDQLRLLGNGVVPSCAAFAFGVLLDRLGPAF